MTAERISLRRSSEKGLVRPLVILEKTHFFKSAPFISEKRKKEKKTPPCSTTSSVMLRSIFLNSWRGHFGFVSQLK